MTLVYSKLLVVYNIGMHIQQIWHPDTITMQQLMHGVHYAAVEPETMRALRPYAAKYHEVAPLTEPFRHLTGKISGGVYHHGSEYNVYTKGWPEDLLQQCTMSEGEREKATLECLHLQGLGLTVIGFGQARSKTASKLPKLTFLGFLGMKR